MHHAFLLHISKNYQGFFPSEGGFNHAFNIKCIYSGKSESSHQLLTKTVPRNNWSQPINGKKDWKYFSKINFILSDNEKTDLRDKNWSMHTN